MLLVEKKSSAAESKSPVQWWILTDYSIVTNMRNLNLQVSNIRAIEQGKQIKNTETATSNVHVNIRDNIHEGQGMSVNMQHTISTFNSSIQKDKTSKKNTRATKLPHSSIGKY